MRGIAELGSPTVWIERGDKRKNWKRTDGDKVVHTEQIRSDP